MRGLDLKPAGIIISVLGLADNDNCKVAGNSQGKHAPCLANTLHVPSVPATLTDPVTTHYTCRTTRAPFLVTGKQHAFDVAQQDSAATGNCPGKLSTVGYTCLAQ